MGASLRFRGGGLNGVRVIDLTQQDAVRPVFSISDRPQRSHALLLSGGEKATLAAMKLNVGDMVVGGTADIRRAMPASEVTPSAPGP